MSRSRTFPLQSSTIIVACSDKLIDAEVDGELVALSIEQGTCYGMNRVASHVWKLLAEPVRICDLCLALQAEYRVDADVCERELLDLLKEFRDEGLVTTVEEE